MRVPSSTLDGVSTDKKQPRAAWGRRGFLGLMLVFVLLALFGFLGMRQHTVSATGGGYRLELRYASIARAGQDVPWELTITRDGGFDGPVTIETTSAYFDIFESQGITPEPSKETAGGTWDRMTFDPPDGDTLVIGLDIYVQPASQQGRSGTARVLGPDGTPVASVDFRTRLLP
ncbi:hypothetical protein [Nocardioides nematodiphilus]|uniref:hypothetical protein n=1 Tax=Nocardioides nematodiphilus TaxID=2849669 RepID=UPI001CD987CC|nr:hypothetical protein [Nocardioides nematodiphilus]MCA1982274.1 hypothetical protein [Nocardioides nematodiphilus]